MVSKRVRSLLNIAPEFEKLEVISEKDRKEKVIILPEAELKNRKIQAKLNELNAKADKKLKDIKEGELRVAKIQIAVCVILFVLTIVMYAYVYLYLQ